MVVAATKQSGTKVTQAYRARPRLIRMVVPTASAMPEGFHVVSGPLRCHAGMVPAPPPLSDTDCGVPLELEKPENLLSVAFFVRAQ